VEEVPMDQVSRYGIVGGSLLDAAVMQVETLIEKPTQDEAPSDRAIIGRYVLTPDIFEAIEQTPRGKGNEIQLTDGLRHLLNRQSMVALTVEGKRYDIGNKLDYLKTQVIFGLKHRDFSAPFRAFLDEYMSRQPKK
jgi:UTP--glucose-1-phosphate uridylyltransferase